MKKIRPFLLPLLGIFALGFALTSVLGRPSESARQPFAAPPSSNTAASIAGIGVVEPSSELVAISTELPGIVRQIAVKPGDRVKQNDILFTLDLREIEAQLAVLRAELKTARLQAQDAAAQFASIKSINDPRAVALDDVNRRRFAQQIAEARIDEITAQIQQAETTRDRQNIRAPMNGEILSVNIRPGEFAQTGLLADPLIRMGQTDILHVRVEIDQENALSVTPEKAAKGFRRGDSETALPLKFVRVEPYIRPKQNLAIAGQRVDTRVVQAIYALPAGQAGVAVGQQFDVFVEDSKQ